MLNCPLPGAQLNVASVVVTPVTVMLLNCCVGSGAVSITLTLAFNTIHRLVASSYQSSTTEFWPITIWPCPAIVNLLAALDSELSFGKVILLALVLISTMRLLGFATIPVMVTGVDALSL